MDAPIPKKRFGQHFLQNTAVLKKIVEFICPAYEDHLIEIGPGLGALTAYLLPHVKTLDVIELDRDLIPTLSARCVPLGELRVHLEDALALDLERFSTIPHSLRIVGNLPYNISTPLLFHFLTQALLIQDMHFMLQKEVVDRMVASPHQASYGRLSVMIQYYCCVKRLFNIDPSAFKPRPKVDSALVRLVPYQTLPWVALDPQVFAKVVRLAFGQRRKTLRNSLSEIIVGLDLADLMIDLSQRAENLSVQDFVKIANWVVAKAELTARV